MHTFHRSQVAVVVLLSLSCLAVRPGYGTTFVAMDEPTLMQSSDVVLTGTVMSITSAAADPTGSIYTYVEVEPDLVIKGQVDSDTVVVRLPGGAVGGRRQWVFGSPEFWVGERTLLFLSRNPDGTLQTNSLSMGKFTLAIDQQGVATAVRDFGEGASVFVPDTGHIADAQPESQALVPLLKRLRRLAKGAGGTAPRRPQTRTAAPDLTTGMTEVHAAFTYLGSAPSRWFEPDSNLPVNYLIDSTGDSRLGFATSRAALDAAFAAWTNIPTSSLILADGGTTSAGEFGPCDINRITFNDPFNEISDPAGCSGILAIGGFCSGTATRVVNGSTFQQIVVGKVTFNNGWGACSFWTQCNLSEVATHELGHTIGLGHSTDGTATMAAIAHFDGRCASLRSDDIDAANFIYPQVGAPPPTATSPPLPIPPPPTATPNPPSGSSNDTCAGAAVVGATPYSNSITTTNATIDASDPTVGCGNGSRSKSVWYRFTAPSNGTLTANTFGSSYDTLLAAYTGSCGAFTAVAGACNDDASGTQSQVAFAASGGTTYYFLISAYSNNGGSLSFQLSFQGAGPTATPTLTFTPAPPTPTRTQTPLPTQTFTAGPPTATFTLGPPSATPTITATRTPTSPGGAPQLNDACSSAVSIDAAPYSSSMVTSGATSEATDPVPSCGNGSRGKSVWYRFTAPSNGTLTASTFGSNYDTILASYTGACGAYAAVPSGCNDDSGGAQSRVSFTATGGTAYYFLVTAYSNNGGTLLFQLSFQGSGPTATATPVVPTPTRTQTPTVTSTFTPGSPTATFTPAPPMATRTATPTSASPFPNDACANAIAIGTVPYAGSVVATSATTETSDPVPGCGNGSRSRSAWYRFTAPSAGALTATTFGSNYDTILAVYTGSCGAFTPVSGACNDDSGGSQSRVAFQATAGTTYTFLVTSYSGTAGTLKFNLSY